ncbi:MAG: SdrD B-like domain-containing protein [Chloroflexota bacterium]
MSSRKTILFVIAAILLIVVILMQLGKPRTVQQVENEISVVMASRDIPPYTILSREYLTTGRVKAAEALNSFDRIEEVVGTITTEEVRSRSIVSRSSILPVDQTWSDDTLIFSFYVPTPRIIGGQLRPGHHIDLLVTRPENRDQVAESLWLGRNLWVVGVYQASGADVPRPTAAVYEAQTTEGQPTPTRATNLGFGGLSLSGGRASEGPANLVVVAAEREMARMIGDYLGARQYDAWLYVRPGASRDGAGTGRIDGVVFSDANRNLIQERGEPGLDGVQITLYDANNTAKKVINTMGGGRLSFDGLAPGTYYVEAQGPTGFVAVSPSKLMLTVAAGQNLHILFANAPLPAPTPQPTAVPTAAPQPTPGAATTGPVAPPCQASLLISDREGGPVAPQPFPAGTNQVWAVIGFQGCAENLPYKLTAYDARESEAKGIPYTGALKGANGSVSLKITPWGGAAEFAAGGYAAVLRLGPANVLAGFGTWTVGAATAQPPALPGEFPVTGGEAPRGDAPGGDALTSEEPQTRFGFRRGY